MVVPELIAVTFVPAAIPVVVEIIIPTAKLVTLLSLIVAEPEDVLPPLVVFPKEQIEVAGETTYALCVVAVVVSPATAPKLPEVTNCVPERALARTAADAGSKCTGAMDMAPVSAAMRANFICFIIFAPFAPLFSR